MARFAYTVLHCLLLPVLFLRVFWRARRSPGYANRWWERLGYAPVSPVDQPAPLWIHTVSVGETVAAKPLVDRLRKEYPECPILMTGMTATGAERVRALFDEGVRHVYAPFDLPFIVALFLKRVKPRALLIMETELWPNWLAACESAKVPAVLLNGRMSQRSARGYARFSALTRPMFRRLSWVAAQNRPDAKRYRFLGVRPNRLTVTGSIKFDIQVDDRLLDLGQEWRASQSQRPVWVAGSTHDGEESALVSAHIALLEKHPRALLILVPRHPERFDSVAQMLDESGLIYERRSWVGDRIAGDTQVLLGDTMGELLAFYAMADWAFVGGSLVPRGGHNPLEPAALGRPILMGPHVFNFAVISQKLKAANALDLVEQSSLQGALLRLAADETLRVYQGQAALSVVEANRGALQAMLAGMEPLVRVDSGAVIADRHP